MQFCFVLVLGSPTLCVLDASASNTPDSERMACCQAGWQVDLLKEEEAEEQKKLIGNAGSALNYI